MQHVLQINQNPWARVGHHGAAVVYEQAAYCWAYLHDDMFPGADQFFFVCFSPASHSGKMTVPPPTDEPPDAEEQIMAGMLHVACCVLHVACCMLHVACGMGTCFLARPAGKSYNGDGIGGGLDDIDPAVWTI